MRKITLITLVVLGISVSAFGQIKVNSSGYSFFGKGTGTTSYGAVNLTEDGVAKGISFNGPSGSSARIFKHNDELYFTRGGLLTYGIKLDDEGRLRVANAYLQTLAGKSPLMVLGTNVTPAVISYNGQAYGDGIKSEVYNSLSNTFAGYLNTGEQTFYVRGNGTVYAKNGYIQSSDRINKEEVKPLENSLDKIIALAPVSFYYKEYAEETLKSLSERNLPTHTEEGESASVKEEEIKIDLSTIEKIKTESNRKRIGLIAQEVEEVVPEVVRTMEDGKKGIMYSDLVSLLIKGMKELKEVVDEKQQYITELEGRLNSIEETVFTEKEQSQTLNNTPQTAASGTKLSQNVPNPFNQETEISYEIPANSNGYIGIYNLNGTQLKKYPLYSAQGNIIISASEFNPGIYIYSLIVDNKEIDSKRMVLTD